MTNPDNQKPAEVADVEAAKTSETATGTSTFSAITQRWKREDLIKKASSIMRGLSLLFSLLAFIIMVSNKHGYGRNFDEYEEYRCQFPICFSFDKNTRICGIFMKDLRFLISDIYWRSRLFHHYTLLGKHLYISQKENFSIAGLQFWSISPVTR